MKAVGIAELKAKLSEYLRQVRRGISITVLDRRHPVARIVPYDRDSGILNVRKPPVDAPKPHEVPLPPPIHVRSDVVELLLEDRGGGR